MTKASWVTLKIEIRKQLEDLASNSAKVRREVLEELSGIVSTVRHSVPDIAAVSPDFFQGMKELMEAHQIGIDDIENQITQDDEARDAFLAKFLSELTKQKG